MRQEAIVFKDRIVGPYEAGEARTLLAKYTGLTGECGLVLPYLTPMDATITVDYLLRAL